MLHNFSGLKLIILIQYFKVFVSISGSKRWLEAGLPLLSGPRVFMRTAYRKDDATTESRNGPRASHDLLGLQVRAVFAGALIILLIFKKLFLSSFH